MATVALEGHRRTRWGVGGSHVVQCFTAATSCGSPTPTSFTRPTVVLLLQGMLYLILALGLSGCVNTGSSGGTGHNGEPAKGLRRRLSHLKRYLESICQVILLRRYLELIRLGVPRRQERARRFLECHPSRAQSCQLRPWRCLPRLWYLRRLRSKPIRRQTQTIG